MTDLLEIPAFLRREPSKGAAKLTHEPRPLTIRVHRPRKLGKRTQARLKALLQPDSVIASLSQAQIDTILELGLYYTDPAFKKYWDGFSRNLDELARQRAAKLKGK